MKNWMLKIACVFACAAVFFSCSPTEKDILPNRRVVLLYGAAFSNLSSDISKNFDDFCKGELPYVGSEDVLLVYMHSTRRYNSYELTEPVLYRAYKDGNSQLRKDTLSVYPATDVSSSPEVMNKVLSDVKEMFPARSYGMLVSSHAKGWLPKGYKEKDISLFSAGKPRKDYPPTKELCIEKMDGSGIDITDLSGALPMYMDFIIMDACLMGCVEVAYELKDKCGLLAFSPTEILSAGMDYHSMPRRLLNIATPDLLGLSKDFYELYNAQSGLMKSATITLVDCAKTEELAAVTAEIIKAHREGFDSLDRASVQKYFYEGAASELTHFFDLRDMLLKAGATEQELSKLDAALDKCVLYKAATEKFFDLELKSVSGLSMYIPVPGNDELNNFYKTLSWNQATGLIQ